jgi:PAS domain S-box-containing protein
MTGYEPAEVLGRAPGEILQNERSDPAVIATMRAALGRGEPCKCEILNRKKDGAEYWVDLDIVPLRDESGVLNGFMAVQSDVTARKAAEDKLRETADRTELALAAGVLDLGIEENWYAVELKINRDTASRYGIQPQLIDDTLYDAFGQRQVTQLAIERRAERRGGDHALASRFWRPSHLRLRNARRSSGITS